MSEKVCVLGALHLDLTVDVERLPTAGETILAHSLHVTPGGKGAAQAVAAARLGCDVDLIGVVGDDGRGSDVRSALLEEGVDLSSLVTQEGVATGVGLRARLASGESATVIGLGANDELGPDQVAAGAASIEGATVLLAQLELSDAALERGFELARACGTTSVLNAAPKRAIPSELLGLVDVLVCNRREAAALCGVDPEEVGDKGLLRRLGALGPTRVVLTRGLEGAVAFDGATVDGSVGGGAYVLGGDQVVDLDGEVLGQPGTLAGCEAQLERLAGRTH
ncbi:MAG: PfkB family carbohydrate kinase, partial [Planctomycetota bacterium]